MRKLFTFLTVILFAGSTFAQTEIYEEHFADSMAVADYGFTTIDQDGDGYNWVVDVYESEIYLVSESWIDGVGALTPNNYLISPEIDLSGYDSAMVTFYLASATSGDFYAEKYRFVIAEGTDVAAVDSGDVIVTQVLDSTYADANWTEHTYDITQHAGSMINLAWVHFDCTDNYKIMLDSILVYEPAVSGINSNPAKSVTLYPNPAHEYLTVNYKGSSTAKVEVYNIAGQLVKNFRNVSNGTTVTVDDLKAGTYILRVRNASGTQSRKFIIE